MKRTLIFTIPLPMPTWNRILAMQHFERMKLRHLLKEFTFMSITYGSDWPTWTDYQSKRSSTDLLRLEYLQTIRPSKSRRSLIRSLKDSLKQQRSR